MLLDMKLTKAKYGILPILAFILICTSCGDSSQDEETKTIQSEKEVAAYDLFPELSEVTIGLGNIIRDGFNELEHEVNMASPNEGGIADPVRRAEFTERHNLRVEALAHLSDNLGSMKPNASEKLLHAACTELALAMKVVHDDNFYLIMEYLRKGIDAASRAKENPFAQMGHKRVEIETVLTQAEGLVSAGSK